MSHSQFGLLTERRFLPFFLTQALGAFNDNVFKNALIVLVTFVMVGLNDEAKHGLTNLAAGLFILPFFLFSAISGQLADKFDKSRIAVAVKVLELAIMIVGAMAFVRQDVHLLLALLFLMGVHSTLFGPLKYGILPQVLKSEELVGGNGLVEMATFIAILLGTILGTSLIAMPEGGAGWVGLCTIVLAALGLLTAWLMPKTAPVDPDLQLDWNVFRATWRNVAELRSNRTVFLSCLGISWFWFFGSIYFTQLPVYTSSVLGGSPAVYTGLLAVFSVGVALGSLLCEKLSGHKVEIGLVPFGAIGMTLFGADIYFAWPEAVTARGLGITEWLAMPGAKRVLVDLVGMALFSGFFIVPLFALVQSRSDPKRRSRVFAANNILNAIFMVIASIISVGLLAKIGLTIPQLLLATAIMNAIVAIYIFTLVPEFLMRFLVWIFINLLYRIDLKGLDNIPEEGPAIVACNHVSFMDALIVGGTVRRPMRFVMYYKIFQMPVVNWLFRAARAIPIAGAKEDPEMLARAYAEIEKALDAGEVVGIFPEGQLTRDGEINPFRSGIERILASRPVPVVPMALRGMWGSIFSRRDSALQRARLPRRFWSRIGLSVDPAWPAADVTAAKLEERVRALRGDWA
ncbi:MAG: MFS transporter [Ahniella sp.]|nr:MFS transporter [Ahniella sp.]